MELAADCPDPSVLEALIFRTYQKDLRNQLKEDTAELRRLQQERQEAPAAAPQEQPVQAKPVTNGFEFSTPPQPLQAASAEPEPGSL